MLTVPCICAGSKRTRQKSAFYTCFIVDRNKPKHQCMDSYELHWSCAERRETLATKALKIRQKASRHEEVDGSLGRGLLSFSINL